MLKIYPGNRYGLNLQDAKYLGLNSQSFSKSVEFLDKFYLDKDGISFLTKFTKKRTCFNFAKLIRKLCKYLLNDDEIRNKKQEGER